PLIFLSLITLQSTVMINLLLYCFTINAPATTEIYTLSLHDALPISILTGSHLGPLTEFDAIGRVVRTTPSYQIVFDAGGQIISQDRKSTRLNSSHVAISYAVFCLKKKNNKF